MRVHPPVGPNLPSAPSTRVDAHDTRDASNERNLLDFIHLTSSRALHVVAHPPSVLRSRPDDEAPQGFLASSERSPSRRPRRRPAPSIDVVERQRDHAIDHRVFAFHRASRRRRRPRSNVPSWRAVQRFKRRRRQRRGEVVSSSLFGSHAAFLPRAPVGVRLRTLPQLTVCPFHIYKTADRRDDR